MTATHQIEKLSEIIEKIELTNVFKAEEEGQVEIFNKGLMINPTFSKFDAERRIFGLKSEIEKLKTEYNNIRLTEPKF